MTRQKTTQTSKIIALMFLLLFHMPILAQKKKEIRPKKFVNLVYMTGSSDFVYYALSEKSRTTIEVTGPGNLTVYNRVRLENNKQASAPYYLKYIMDDKRITSEKIGPQEISKKIKYKNKLQGTPSKADKEIIKIPPGKHRISFFKYKTKQKAHVRFIFQPTEKMNWKEITAANNLDPVNIQYSKTKKQQQYYRITNKTGFSFQSDNNRKIRIFLRADFDYKMHRENVIRFVLKKNGVPLKTYKVTCKKSNTVQNLSNKSLIPGALEKIFIDIPSNGKDHYEIVLKDPKKSAMIRVFLGKNNASIIKPTS